jgi:hypothetical protein
MPAESCSFVLAARTEQSASLSESNTLQFPSNYNIFLPSSLSYNNFLWPRDPTDKQKSDIEETAQGILDARAAHPDASLADLYDHIAMPPDLRKAHQALDKAVDAAYGKKTFASDAERVAYLIELYHKYTSLLLGPETHKRRKK